MTQTAQLYLGASAAAFDGLAESYDAVFTNSAIGRAQRRAVWSVSERIFRFGDHLLDLNCGTGEDALFLGHSGHSVVACDASLPMIDVARRRKSSEGPQLPVQFRVLRTEQLHELNSSLSFDGALSNFSGLNCVADLSQVASDLARMVKRDAPVLICLSTRVCIWEIAWFLSRGEARKAFRRVRGKATARVGGHTLPVWYPTIRRIRKAFAPWFQLRAARAVGLFVPPSYLEPWAARHPKILARMEQVDRAAGSWPLLRGLGDHVLLHFQKAGQ